MNFLAQDPLRRAEEEMNVRPNYIRGGPGVQQGPSITDQLMQKAISSMATKALAGTALGPAAPFVSMLFNNGTSGVPEMDYGPDPLQGYMNGTNYVGYNQGTNMAYAGGTDSVPAMLTPGEAVIPAAAAQNPQNKPAINAMVAEGRQANSVANGTAFLNDGTQEVSESMPQEPMMGPLSGKSQREERKSQMEEMKNLQEMSLKKKAWEAEESRKQKAFEQKYAHNDMKAMLSMRQS
jgi:hypothetical protein